MRQHRVRQSSWGRKTAQLIAITGLSTGAWAADEFDPKLVEACLFEDAPQAFIGDAAEACIEAHGETTIARIVASQCYELERRFWDQVHFMAHLSQVIRASRADRSEGATSPSRVATVEAKLDAWRAHMKAQCKKVAAPTNDYAAFNIYRVEETAKRAIEGLKAMEAKP